MEQSNHSIGASKWNEFVGQKVLMNKMEVEVKATLFGPVDEDDLIPFPHTLMDAFPGAGKTTLASLIAKRIGSDLISLVMPVDPKVLERTIRELDPGNILFLDEIHLAPKRQQETLLTLMEQAFYQLKSGEVLEVPDITVMAATTKPQLLDDAFKDRFVLHPRFQPYTSEEMAGIVNVMQGKASLDLDDQTIIALGNASGGTPRNARRLVLAAQSLKMAHDFTPNTKEILHHAGVTYDGLTDLQVAYLKALKRFNGTAGAAKIANILRVNTASLSEIERYMFDSELIDYTDQGRTLTVAGHRRTKEL